MTILVYNDETNNLGLLQDITAWTKADKGITDADLFTSYTLKDRTRDCNFALDDIVSIILEADGKWKWDDTNNTDQPVGKTNLMADQQDYGIPGTTFLKINEVQRLDSDDKWITLIPVAEDSEEGKKLMRKRNSGNPKYYIKRGNSVYLHPIPNAATTNGLRIFFQRDVHYFVTTDTTAEPGFPQPFHRLVSLKASLDYCEQNGMVARAAMIRNRIAAMEVKLREHFASRDADRRTRLEFRKEDYGHKHLKEIGGGTGRYTPHNVI